MRFHRIRALGIAAFLAGANALLIPEVARAAEGSEGQAGSTLVVVSLVGAVVLAYLLAHTIVDRLQKAFLIMAGVEYLILGLLLGPEVPEPFALPAFQYLDTPSDERGSLLPIVALAVGWIGLLRGMELSVARLREQAPTGTSRVVVVQALVAGGVTVAAAYFAFTRGWLFPFGVPATSEVVGPREVWMAAGVLGCAAAAGSVEPIELLKRRYRLEGRIGPRIRQMAAMSDLLAIVVFGVLFCMFHTSNAEADTQLRAFEWVGISVFLGALLGVLFTPFLGDDDSENGRFLALTGIIVLASGAAYFLDLSPLLVNLCLGAVLVNTAKAGPKIRATLENTRRPIVLLLLVFAGALWRPVDPMDATLVSLGYIALRLIGKAVGTNLAGWRSPIRGDYFRGLLAHGDVTVAMAVSLRLVYEGPAIDLAYTAILVSVVVNDLIAPRVLRGLLVDTGDLRGERKEEPA